MGDRYLSQSTSKSKESAKIQNPVDLSVDVDDATLERTSSTENIVQNEDERNHREKIEHVIHSTKFQYGIIALVSIDCLIVIIQLCVDLQYIKLKHGHHNPYGMALHYISICILGIFIIELFIKIYAMGLKFFKHKLEVFDGIVVIISFALDIAYSGNEDAWDAVGLIVLLRLWRIARIVNGIVVSVETAAEQKIHSLQTEKEELEETVTFLQEKCTHQEKEIAALKESLQALGHDS